MDWEEFFLARQLLAEELPGLIARMAERAEDAVFEQNKSRLPRG